MYSPRGRVCRKGGRPFWPSQEAPEIFACLQIRWYINTYPDFWTFLNYIYVERLLFPVYSLLPRNNRCSYFHLSFVSCSVRNFWAAWKYFLKLCLKSLFEYLHLLRINKAKLPSRSKCLSLPQFTIPKSHYFLRTLHISITSITSVNNWLSFRAIFTKK